MKKTALLLIVILVGLLGWGLIQSGDISVTVNGQELSGPMKVALGGWGFVVSTVVFFCVAILLVFVLAGIGLVVLGSLLLFGLILAALLSPILLPLLIPLFIVWAFVAGMRRGNRTNAPR